MKISVKENKKLLVIASALLGTGIIVCVTASAMIGFDFKKLSTANYVSNTYKADGTFKNISITADNEDVSFFPSKDGRCSVVCYEDKDQKHNVRVENGTLIVDRAKNSKSQVKIGFVTESPQVNVYLPEEEYQLLTIDSDTGDVDIPKNFSFDNVSVSLDTGNISCLASVNGNVSLKTDTGQISVSEMSTSDMILSSDTGKVDISDVVLTGNISITENTGNVTMKNISCKKFASNGDTGDLVMTNVVASDEFDLKRQTGDIKFDGCDAETIYTKTDTGYVKGTLLSEKVFITETDTGNVDVPKTITGGRCEITTDTGDIKISIQ